MRSRSRAVRAVLPCAVTLALLAPAWAARADDPPPGAAASGVSADADVHFRRGVDLFRERAFGGALTEFRRAYQIAPSYRVLYNIALCHAELREYAQAHAAYRQYLDAGGK